MLYSFRISSGVSVHYLLEIKVQEDHASISQGNQLFFVKFKQQELILNGFMTLVQDKVVSIVISGILFALFPTVECLTTIFSFLLLRHSC